MAAISWNSGISGNWNTASDWSTDTVPGSGDDVTIAASGPYIVSLTTPITVNSITISDTSATLAVADSGGTETVTGDLTNSGTLDVDTGSYEGGSTVTAGGALDNSGSLDIGNGNLSASTTVTAAGLGSLGNVNLAGSTTGTNQATLDFTAAAAPTSVTGTVYLSGDALLEFASDSIQNIASTGSLTLEPVGANARVADAGDTAHNSALSGLSSNAGIFSLFDASVTTASGVDFTNSGEVEIGNPGSSLGLGGVLTNTTGATIYIFGGGGALAAAGLVNAGAIQDIGGTFTLGGPADNTGTLSLGGGALTLTSGALTNSGGLQVYQSATLSTASGFDLNNSGAFNVDTVDLFQFLRELRRDGGHADARQRRN
jgi:hypothetical protein